MTLRKIPHPEEAHRAVSKDAFSSSSFETWILTDIGWPSSQMGCLSGEEVIIARNGEPLVRLTPMPKKRERRVPGSTDEEVTESVEGPISTNTETP
jgi:hypothetical protein